MTSVKQSDDLNTDSKDGRGKVDLLPSPAIIY